MFLLGRESQDGRSNTSDGSLERDEQSRSDKTFEVTEIILQSDMDM